MKNHLLKLIVIVLCLAFSSTYAQTTDTNYYNYGIWQTFGDPVSRTSHPEILGRLCNFRWKELETAPGVWNWTQFDSDLTVRAEDGLPIIFMVYTEEDAPDWLYSNGVPKVAQRDDKGNLIAYCPYYADPTYKMYFERMIYTVRHHLDSLPAFVRNQVIAVQACFGSTGDYISYKGDVDPQYELTSNDFFELFKEFSQYYYDQYKDSNPKIYLLSNPQNNGEDQYNWLIANLPDSWVKTGSLGKGFQLNDEVSKSAWLYPIINSPQVGNYIRARSEIIGGALSSGWWNESPYQNMFALMSYCIYWGVDWSNQGLDQIDDPLFDSAFSFYNKYAGQKDPLKANNALCALHDGIDASDTKRFPESVYGAATRTTSRFNSVLQPFIPYGAKLEDPATATAGEMDQLSASGINDVGWNIFPGNYERFLHQVDADATSIGYWNVQSGDKNAMFGRFARGFDLAHGKDALYFDVDDVFLHNAPLKSQYPVMIDITYLDKGTGQFRLYYDAQDSSNKPSATITCTNTGLWKKASVTLNDAYFGNRGTNASDFSIRNSGNSDIIFAVVELTRPSENSNYTGYAVSAPLDFGSVCVNSTSPPNSFTLSASFLTDPTTVIGPEQGFVFASSFNGPYTDSLVIKNSNASFYQTIYVKYKPVKAGLNQATIPVTGGGVVPLYIPATATAFDNTSLSATVDPISCYNAKDGSIDLKETGGTGPFTFSWTSADGYRNSTEDISGLKPSVYTVTVNSTAGCVATATYEIKQPDELAVKIQADPIICKGGTTTAQVSASGGTLPYTGTGSFTVNAGYNSFTVTDSNGCVAKGSISLDRGTLTAPAKPAAIISPLADTRGLCNGGDFEFSVDEVMAATSYTWHLPTGSKIKTSNYDSSQVTITFPATFNSDIISVAADNVCGTSNFLDKNVVALPGQPGPINGPTAVLAAQQDLLYSVEAVDGLTYNWTVPGKTIITSGQYTSSITANWGTLSGSIKVKAENGCGSSTASSSLMVNVVSNALTTSLASLPTFDTTCINGSSKAQSFDLNATGLDGSDIVVGPLSGYSFATSTAGPYSGTVTIAGYGNAVNKTIYVKFTPSSTGYIKGTIQVNGGGAAGASVKVSGTAVNSSPLLDASILNTGCNGSSDGAINLSVTGGSAPFTYQWSGNGILNRTSQDIDGLTAGSYSVSVTSYAGCKTTASYTVRQPDPLAVSLSADNIICNGGSTTVHVSALGGTLPYKGVGDYSNVTAGSSTYTVTDGNGCAASGSINLTNGSQASPWNPSVISSDSADAKGVCGGGDFQYSVATVSGASSYSWGIPAGSSIVSAAGDSSRITLHIPSGFRADSISVRAMNSCGTSEPVFKPIVAIPSTPGLITGPVFVNEGEKNVSFSIPPVGGLSYIWTVPSGVNIISGQNTPAITVKWGKSSGKVSVTALNDCGTSSSASDLNVQVIQPGIFNISPAILPAFQSTCINGTSEQQEFLVTASALTGEDIVIGNASGFTVATTPDGPYTADITLRNYGSSISQVVYVRFNPSAEGMIASTISISGGGIPAATIPVTGTAIKNNVSLDATVHNITCDGLQNGSIDVVVNGAPGPYVFQWSGTGGFTATDQRLDNLAAGNYTVSVSASGGCTATGSYQVSQPDPLHINAAAGIVSCTTSTTDVQVSATGGTLPYTGTGTYTGVTTGNKSFTVTDANGCTVSDTVAIAPPAGAPEKPGTISNSNPEGLCGGGDFTFSIDPVMNATSYSWIPPSGCAIKDMSANGTSITLSAPAGFASGTLSVSAGNSCGTSEPSVAILNTRPANPGKIAGPSSIATYRKGLVYSIDAQPGVTYQWQVPEGVQIRSGQYTNMIVVDWGSRSGEILVTAVNACGTSVASTIMVIAGDVFNFRPVTEGDKATIDPSMFVMPNPVQKTAVVNYMATYPGKYTVQVYSVAGKLLQQLDGMAHIGQNLIRFDVGNFVNGMYMVTLITEKGERKSAKLLKE